MFFMFTFSTIVAIIIAYRLSNAYEKMYSDEKTDTENESNEENVNLGDVYNKNN